VRRLRPTLLQTLVLSKAQMKTGYVAVAEGAADANALKPTAGIASVAASSYACAVGDTACPWLGFGHGNRVEPILFFNLSTIPRGAIIDNALLEMKESEGWDYDQEVGLAPIISTVPFEQLT